MEKEIRYHVVHFTGLMDKLKVDEYKTYHQKFLELNTHYANIISILSGQFPSIKLKDLESITALLNDYNDKYYERLLS